MITPVAPPPSPIEIRIIKRRCGIERERSTSQDTNESSTFPMLESKPNITLNTVLIVDAKAPINILNPSPPRVLVNISLPIQSVPKGCSREGARFFDPKSVGSDLLSINKLEITIVINNSDINPINRMVLCLRFIPMKDLLFIVTTAVLMMISPAVLSWGRGIHR
ncbi:MAG: hypothetical protein A4E23_01150 [Methanomethylovorans sp. PtaU1.Bin073]|nr:MAG: hypothetical protein A4E23_01150 [Methanomethylovorans sp. PtaU1.Bin073]